MQKKILKGFSLIELLLAGALFSLFAWGIVGVLLSSLDTNRLGEETTEATEYATEGIEAVRSVASKNFDAVTNIDATGIQRSGGEWELMGASTENTFKKFTRVIMVETVLRDDAGNISEESGAEDPDTKKVTVTVFYNIASARANSIVLTTYLTRFK